MRRPCPFCFGRNVFIFLDTNVGGGRGGGDNNKNQQQLSFCFLSYNDSEASERETYVQLSSRLGKGQESPPPYDYRPLNNTLHRWYQTHIKIAEHFRNASTLRDYCLGQALRNVYFFRCHDTCGVVHRNARSDIVVSHCVLWASAVRDGGLTGAITV